jgi:CheY-like chemotaxis protein
MKILVIDDDGLLRESARDALEDRGHEVGEASSGAEGLRMAEEGTYDMVVCDMQMPGGMNGLEVWARLPDHLRARFLLWTGTPDLAAGVDVRVLAKPSGYLELLDAVEEVYKG